jgi:DnaK suppressor protein
MAKKKTAVTDIIADNLNAGVNSNAPKNMSLTEDDIVKMPESEYMNQVQLDFFKNELLLREREILKNAEKTMHEFREQETNYVADPSDRATIEEEHALELRTRDRERKLLQKIRKALYLIETGEYGFCEDTGEPIGLKRLIARPTATLTVEAQERREKMQKHFAEE